MAKVAKPSAGSGEAVTVAAGIVADFTADGFKPDEDASAQEVTASTAKGIGTAAHKPLTLARDALLAKGQKPPTGLTLRATRGKATQSGGRFRATVTYYYGPPIDKTDVKYIGA